MASGVWPDLRMGLVCVCVTGSGGNLGREPGNVSVCGADEIQSPNGLLSLLENPAKASSRCVVVLHGL